MLFIIYLLKKSSMRKKVEINSQILLYLSFISIVLILAIRILSHATFELLSRSTSYATSQVVKRDLALKKQLSMLSNWDKHVRFSQRVQLSKLSNLFYFKQKTIKHIFFSFDFFFQSSSNRFLTCWFKMYACFMILNIWKEKIHIKSWTFTTNLQNFTIWMKWCIWQIRLFFMIVTTISKRISRFWIFLFC